MTHVVAFSREYRPHIEILRIRDRTDGRPFYVFKLVGRDELGPYQLDMGDCFTFHEVTEAVQDWWREGVEVDGREVLP